MDFVRHRPQSTTGEALEGRSVEKRFSRSRVPVSALRGCGPRHPGNAELYCPDVAILLRQHGRADHADVDRSAAGCARGDADGARRRGRHVACRSGDDDHRAEHRSGRVVRRAHLPGHRHADLRGQGPGRREPDLDEAADPRGHRRGHAPRQAAAELGRLDHRRELRQQPRPRHADRPLRAVGGAAHRGAADPQGRRLREHQRAVRAAGRRSIISAAPIARSKACASASSTRCGRRRARAAVRAPSASASAAIAPRATCRPRNSCSARSTTRIPDPRLAALEEAVLDEANRLTVGPMGFSGKTTLIGCKMGALNRLPASFFVSIAYDCWAFRRLGVNLDATTGAITSWMYRDAGAVAADAVARGGRRRLPAHRPRDSSAGADLRGRRPQAEGRRRRADLRAASTPAATPSTRT